MKSSHRHTAIQTLIQSSRLMTLALLIFVMTSTTQAASLLVDQGKPNAQIIISDSPTRSQRVAANELQYFIKRMTGATLPVADTIDQAIPFKIFVGSSSHTNKLNISDEKLVHGGFRMVSGDDWLVLIGDDTDWVGNDLWAANPYDDKEVAEVQARWDAASGGKYGNVIASTHRRYCPLLDLWQGDERGSLNAVYRFMSDLGVRWYYPGEMGLIIPASQNIKLPAVDITSIPDFQMRDLFIYFREFFHVRKGTEHLLDDLRWQLWLGVRSHHETVGYATGHGTIAALSRDEMKQAHPEYYALKSGKRATTSFGYGAPCLSSKGLVDENVKMVRAIYDVLEQPMMSVAPSDGYTLCECELCKGKDTPERGFLSSLSDYVWPYVDQVARELYKTHPDKHVHSIAYSPYLEVPSNVEMFSPNVIMGICDWRSLNFDPKHRQDYLKLRQDWLAKLPSKQLWIWDYYLHGAPRSGGGGPWWAAPAFFPNIIVEDLRSLKGISLGDYIEIYGSHATEKTDGMAINHLNTYITAKFLWSTDNNLPEMLEEYYRLYYGPAASEMKTFIEYSEQNWMKTNSDHTVIDRIFELIEPAILAAGPADSIYAKRIDVINQYMQRLKPLRERLAKGRDHAPQIRALGRDASNVTIDGKADEDFWQGLPVMQLSNLQTGATPTWATSFKAAWSNGSLYLAIDCDDRPGEKVNITTRTPGSTGVWDGDNIEILLETQTHTYYQIAINPAGVMVDVDRKSGIEIRWDSAAQVACREKEDGGWSVEIRIPAAGSQASNITPLVGVAGDKPTESYPWYFNIGRQRHRTDSHELSAFSPTGKPNYHDPMLFAVIWSP